MKKFRLVVAYDGTGFHGWQRQPAVRTVQGVLEEGMRQALEVDDLLLHGAGRTDAGVHARGQVASFSAATRLPARAIGPRVNPTLPTDVRIVDAFDAAPDFDARRSASARRYSYRLLWLDDLLWSRFAWCPRQRWRGEGLDRAVQPLEGEHDFSAFRSAGSSSGSPRCRLHRAGWRRWEGGVELNLVADHFLYHMVRNVVGTALAAATARDPEAAMEAVLASRDRGQAGMTAPAQGLCLEQVFYPGEEI